ncbi:hypothetical protein J2T56_003054 [Natronobacillus azotifigens]|uniref:DUF3397 family protein n=1 Tax=Natronobacillus azotifigens TaxID=472978 RepID=A0A9J6RGG0_9BACI|nr:DUF3397 family protein [Natronobacillus azotifigens]MCZ0704526.1 DUF3397 family protein [Natronobacillus azotifigens]
MLQQLFAYLLGIMVTFPLLVTLLLYYLFKKSTGNKKYAVHASMQYSACFYLLSFFVIVDQTFGSSYIGWTIVILLTLLLFFIIIQWKLIGDIIFKRVWQLFLRTIFFLFFIINFLIIIIALLLKLVS